MLATLAGMLAGTLVGFLIKNGANRWPGHAPAPSDASLSRASGMHMEAADAAAALRYAQALMDGDWDTVIDQTLWMRERLDHVRLESGSEEAVARERMRLMQWLAERTPPENQLRPEGVEDQFVFAPGTAVAVARVDAGRDDLERPVVSRAWLRVTFPRRDQALRDARNLPVRAITVGVNVDNNGRVLKAGVIGNLEIDEDSISRDWESVQGG